MSKLEEIYHKHYWMMSVKKSHEKVNIGHLENKTKFEVSDNTSVTPSVKQIVNGNMNTPSENITVNPSNIGL